MEAESTPGEIYYEDGVRYITMSLYGMDAADTIMIYLPGQSCSEIPQQFIDWVYRKTGSELGSTLPDGFYGLYVINSGIAFTAQSDD